MYITIGRIIQTHGTGGYVKAVPYSGIPERFIELKTVYIDSDEGIQGFIIEDVQLQNGASLLKLRGVETREAARVFLKKELLVPEEQKISLPANSYFIHELIGCAVFDIHGQYIGQLEEVLVHAGSDIYVVRREDQETLIPAVSEFVKEIRPDEKKILVALIEGMAD